MSKSKSKPRSSGAKSKKSTKGKVYKRGSLKEAIYKLFDKKGVTKVT